MPHALNCDMAGKDMSSSTAILRVLNWQTMLVNAVLTLLECTQGGLYENVSPEIMAAAKPLLTGNQAADADIIKFYQAKAALESTYAMPMQQR